MGNIVLADNVTVVTANTTYTLTQLQGMRFLTATNANGGPATFTWTVQDSGGVANGGVDTLTESLTTTITAVNDAPVLDNSGTMTLVTIDEDNVANTGDAIGSIVLSAGGDRITDFDSAFAFEGFAVTGISSGNGSDGDSVT